MNETTVSHFYTMAVAPPETVPMCERVIQNIIKAHQTAGREGLLYLAACVEKYDTELEFYLKKLELPQQTFTECAFIKLSQVAGYPAKLICNLLAYRGAIGILRGEDALSLLAVLKTILGRGELELDLATNGRDNEVDAILWRGSIVLHFSDVANVAETQLQALMREVSWEDTARAFSRSSRELRERLLAQCSPRRREDLRIRMALGASDHECKVAQETWLETMAKLIGPGDVGL